MGNQCSAAERKPRGAYFWVHSCAGSNRSTSAPMSSTSSPEKAQSCKEPKDGSIDQMAVSSLPSGCVREQAQRVYIEKITYKPIKLLKSII